jgi:hypothetical protein
MFFRGETPAPEFEKSVQPVSASIPEDMYEYVSFSPSIIKIDEDNLLPGSQSHLSFNEGDGKRRFHQGCPYM